MAIFIAIVGFIVLFCGILMLISRLAFPYPDVDPGKTFLGASLLAISLGLALASLGSRMAEEAPSAELAGQTCEASAPHAEG